MLIRCYPEPITVYEKRWGVSIGPRLGHMPTQRSQARVRSLERLLLGRGTFLEERGGLRSNTRVEPPMARGSVSGRA